MEKIYREWIRKMFLVNMFMTFYGKMKIPHQTNLFESACTRWGWKYNHNNKMITLENDEKSLWQNFQLWLLHFIVIDKKSCEAD